MNFKGVDKSTWARIITLILVLVNQISVSLFDFQLLPYADEQIYEGVSVVLSVVVTIWASWKNNSFTYEAQEADKLLKSLKKGADKE